MFRRLAEEKESRIEEGHLISDHVHIGKATSPLQALKTGLTGRTVLLPSEDAALYEAHLAQFRQQDLALVARVLP